MEGPGEVGVGQGKAAEGEDRGRKWIAQALGEIGDEEIELLGEFGLIDVEGVGQFEQEAL